MLDFTKGEETQLEQVIKEIHDSGIRVIVAGGVVGELALHYISRYEMLVIKVMSKFELRRLCRVVGATPLARLGAPMPDETGIVDVVETEEIGGDRVTVFRQGESLLVFIQLTQPDDRGYRKRNYTNSNYCAAWGDPEPYG